MSSRATSRGPLRIEAHDRTPPRPSTSATCIALTKAPTSALRRTVLPRTKSTRCRPHKDPASAECRVDCQERHCETPDQLDHWVGPLIAKADALQAQNRNLFLCVYPVSKQIMSPDFIDQDRDLNFRWSWNELALSSENSRNEMEKKTNPRR